MNLDDKLREIVADKPYPEQAIADIKQAFKDEGYAQFTKLNGAFKPRPDLPRGTVMTGKVWYNRFLMSLPLNGKWEAAADEVREAAERASGIKE